MGRYVLVRLEVVVVRFPGVDGLGVGVRIQKVEVEQGRVAPV